MEARRETSASCAAAKIAAFSASEGSVEVGVGDGVREEEVSMPMSRKKSSRSSSPANGELEGEELAPTPITPPGVAPVLGVGLALFRKTSAIDSVEKTSGTTATGSLGDPSSSSPSEFSMVEIVASAALPPTRVSTSNSRIVLAPCVLASLECEGASGGVGSAGGRTSCASLPVTGTSIGIVPELAFLSVGKNYGRLGSFFPK